jgi:hypothetical protein
MADQKVSPIISPYITNGATSEKGFPKKDNCMVATTANITYTYVDSTPTADKDSFISVPLFPDIDGIPLTDNDKFLVKDQTDKKQNGIYFYSKKNNRFVRSSDWDRDVQPISDNTTIAILSGAVNSGTEWRLTDTVSFVGINNANFVSATSGSGGGGGGGTVTNVTGTVGRINVGTGTTTPVIDISIGYTGQSSITTVGTILSGFWNGHFIDPPNGGTGFTSYTVGQILYANAPLTLAKLNIGAPGQVLTVVGGLPSWQTPSGGGGGGSGTVTNVTGTAGRITVGTGTTTPVIDISIGYIGQNTITTVGIISTGVWEGAIIQPAFGGTGLSTIFTGDLVYGSNINEYSPLPIGSAGQVLTVFNGFPAWRPSGGGGGTVPATQGGTGLTTYNPGDMLYSNATNQLVQIPIGGPSTVLQSTGGLPAWSTIITTDFCIGPTTYDFLPVQPLGIPFTNIFASITRIGNNVTITGTAHLIFSFNALQPIQFNSEPAGASLNYSPWSFVNQIWGSGSLILADNGDPNQGLTAASFVLPFLICRDNTVSGSGQVLHSALPSFAAPVTEFLYTFTYSFYTTDPA